MMTLVAFAPGSFYVDIIFRIDQVNLSIIYLNIELFSQKKQSVQYSILGMQGQQVLSGSSSLLPGNTNIKLSLGALAAGTYLMKITEDNGKTVRSIQFIKG